MAAARSKPTAQAAEPRTDGTTARVVAVLDALARAGDGRCRCTSARGRTQRQP